MRSRIVQLVCLVLAVASIATGGAILPKLLRRTEEAGLRYTNVAVEGAPFWVALGTSIGALRGLIVDVLWIKVHYMKERGLFYEVMADAELITRLQPRFAAVWAFHGHNMAYNISVSTHTQEERWSWVEAGIRLVRNEGLRYNPNDIVLHKELAFWFAHKIEGYADDAHLYYKRMFCQEWHFVLGAPPDAWEDRTAWMKEIADAPASMEELYARSPECRTLVDRLDGELTPFGEQVRFKPDRAFLVNWAMWQAVTERESAAEILGVAQRFRATSPFFNAFDAIASDPEAKPAWAKLLAAVRHKVLVDEYNMDPQLMYEFTRDLGPIDWRHGQAHALYWARKGSLFADTRYMDVEGRYKVLNTDRLQLQAMQDLARWGRITFDPFSSELPARFPDPRWIDSIDHQFAYFYEKYYDSRGAGGETFISFLENFMGSAVREAYRSGERERAERLLAQLDARFGRGLSFAPNNKYNIPLDVFVKNQIRDEYEFQPHLAPSEAVASMRAGFRMGVGRGDEDVWRQALVFVNQVITIFKENEYYDFTTKFGDRRMADLLTDFPTLQRVSFIQLMTDPTVQVREKAVIWSQVDKFAPLLRLETYDDVIGGLGTQVARTELGQKYTAQQLFPAPPGLEEYRARVEAERARAAKAAEEARKRDTIEAK